MTVETVHESLVYRVTKLVPKPEIVEPPTVMGWRVRVKDQNVYNHSGGQVVQVIAEYEREPSGNGEGGDAHPNLG